MRNLGFIAVWLAAANLAAAGEHSVSVEKTSRSQVGKFNGIPMVAYRFAEVPFKPYVEMFSTPGGLNVLRDSPEDHKHHHALMFAVKVDDVNFWEEYPERQPGTQVHQGFTSAASASCEDGIARIELPVETIDWNGPDGTTLLKETRSIRVQRNVETPSAGSVLTWTSRFEVPQGRAEAVLTGAHYHGLGVRFPVSMDGVGTHFNAAGELGPVYRGSERLTETKWTAYTAPVDGKPVTVAVFDDPKNARPAVMFTMLHGFAYVSATLDLEKRPLSIQTGKPLVLRYGVVAWDGEKSAEEVEKAYQDWIQATPAE